MQKYYTDEIFIQAKKQRNVNLIIYFSVFAVYLAVSAVLFAFYRVQPYNDEKILTIKILNGIWAGIFVIFSFVFLGIPYKRVNKFYKMCLAIKDGVKTTSVGNFLECNDELRSKDGVDMKALVFLEWSDKKQDYYERQVLVFYEKPFPEIPQGADVKYITKGNVLVEYEILEGEE